MQPGRELHLGARRRGGPWAARAAGPRRLTEALGAMARRVLRLWKRRRLRVAQALLAAGRRAEAARALEEHLRAVAGRQGDESQLRVALARHLLCIARGETPQEISRDYVEALEKVYK